MGLALRCSGAGEKVLLFQFLKGNNSSERNSIQLLPNITVVEGQESVKFVYQMTEDEKQELKKYYEKKFMDLTEMVKDNKYRLLVMDELVATVNCGLVEEAEVLQFLKKKPESLEVVLTGRNPSKKICESADYVTEMKKIKHPFEQNIPARRAIEF